MGHEACSQEPTAPTMPQRNVPRPLALAIRWVYDVSRPAGVLKLLDANGQRVWSADANLRPESVAPWDTNSEVRNDRIPADLREQLDSRAARAGWTSANVALNSPSFAFEFMPARNADQNYDVIDGNQFAAVAEVKVTCEAAPPPPPPCCNAAVLKRSGLLHPSPSL